MSLRQLLFNRNSEVLNLMFVKVPGACVEAPCVEISITGYTGKQSSKIIARIDTGADISCIPKSLFRQIMPVLQGPHVLIRDHQGSISRERTFLGSIDLWDGKKFYMSVKLKRGFVVQDMHDTALVGMDVILPYFRLEGEGRNWRLIPR